MIVPRVLRTRLIRHGLRILIVMACGAAPAAANDPPTLVFQQPHADTVCATAFTDDGSLLATGSLDGSAALWDTKSGRLLRKFRHQNSVCTLDFSHDGKVLATGSYDMLARTWNTSTGEQIAQFVWDEAPVLEVRMVGNGRFLLSTAGSGKYLQDLHEKKNIPLNSETPIAIAPNGRALLSISELSEQPSISLRDPRTTKLVRRFNFAATDANHPAAFSHDSKFFVVRTASNEAQVFSTQGVLFRSFVSLGKPITAVALSNNAGLLALAWTSHESPDRRGISLFDTRNGKPIFEKTLPNASILEELEISHSGALILVNTTANAFILDARTGDVLECCNGRLKSVRNASLTPTGLGVAGPGQIPGTFQIYPIHLGLSSGKPGPAPYSTIETHALANIGQLLVIAGAAVRIIDLRSGDLIRNISIPSSGVRSIGSSNTGARFAVGMQDGTIKVWDALDPAFHETFQAHKASINSISFSSNDQALASSADDGSISIWNTSNWTRRVSRTVPDGVQQAIFVPSCDCVAYIKRPSGRIELPALQIWKVDDDTLMPAMNLNDGDEGIRYGVYSLAHSVGGSSLIVGGGDRSARVWDPQSAEQASNFGNQTERLNPVTAVTMLTSKPIVATGLKAGRIHVWTGSPPLEIESSDSLLAHSGAVKALSISGDGRWLLSTGEDKMLHIWDIDAKQRLAQIAMGNDGSLYFFGQHGQIDVAGIREGIEDAPVHWVAPDDPFRPLPIEIFMRDYYEPRLLQRLLLGQKISATPSPTELNRVQPKVKIVSAVPEPKPCLVQTHAANSDTADVTVEVSGAERIFDNGGKRRTERTGVFDLRLFRDGQLVAQQPIEPEKAVKTGLTEGQERDLWREQRELRKFEAGILRVDFKDVRLPRRAGQEKVEFSAYAFNADRVKSETVRCTYFLAADRAPRKPKAYLVTIGVNSFSDQRWNLKYAANDARQSGSELEKMLRNQKTPEGASVYEDVVLVSLISDIGVAQAGKVQIEATIKTLAGQAANSAALNGVASAERLRSAYPEDLVIIVLSTHGVVDKRQILHFLPSDIGTTFEPNTPDPADMASMFARAVSTDELAQWMRGLDAIDQVMIIDACHSAASVQSGEFKPGPMGSRGLGQLAYDKGMRILAATQADQDAVEKDQTKMGLLIYALIEDGLRAGLADTSNPKDGRIMLSEWLNYGSARVPGVFKEVRDGTLKGSKGTLEYAKDEALDVARRNALQRPALFDFARGRDLPILDK